MDGETTRRRALQLLADALEYPRPGLLETVRECAALLAADNPGAAACLREFCAFVEETPRGRLEELYTGTFDLNAACYPYVGYHLFGESYKRSIFMVELNERYRAHVFPVTGELPDHLTVLLRFLAVCDDAALSEELICEALLPALERMEANGGAAGGAEERARPGYGLVLQALRLALQPSPPDTLPREAPRKRNSPFCLVEIVDSAKGPWAKPRYSLQRIKAVFGSVAKRKAVAQRRREQWAAGYIR